MVKINEVEIVEFKFEIKNMGSIDGNKAVYNIGYIEGAVSEITKYAIIIKTDEGHQGEYVMHWGGTASSMAQTVALAGNLIGRNPYHREQIYDDFKREMRQHDHMGQGAIDIALWDLAGKSYGASVAQLLGGYRDKIKAYASTYHGDHNGGLDCKEAYADFAEQCYDMGYRAYKVHGWKDGEANIEAANVLNVRKQMGDRMVLMLDPCCELRTFADALYVGRACDEANYFWYEDPFRDCGTSAFAHKMLREKLKTPLLQTEFVRGIEPKADFLVAGGTDFLRADPEYDMGITGVMKIAHLAESLGTDVELHATGPAHRACISAIRNTNYYEIALVGPNCMNAVPPVYTCGYNDQLDCIDADGCVPIPSGPGLGVSYDWDFIRKNQTANKMFR